MQRIIYTSVITRDAASRLASTVEDVLVASAGLNQRDELSGFLLCDGVYFAQVLEGPEAALGDCYRRILRDQRHEGLQAHHWGEAGARLFGRWSMCGLTLSPMDDAVLEPVDIEFDLRGAGPEPLLQHLAGLAARHAATLDRLHDAMLGRLQALGL